MGALTETTAQAVTEFSGKVKVITALIDGAATGTIDVAAFTAILSVSITLAEAATATSCSGYAAAVSGNDITITGFEGDGTICTQTALDFWLTVIGY